MHRALIAAAAVLVLPVASIAASRSELCGAAKLRAAGAYSRCRGKADSAFAKSDGSRADVDRRDAAYGRCGDALGQAYADAELRFGSFCPTTGDVVAVRSYLSRCAQDVKDATRPDAGPVPDYVEALSSCATDLSTARAGNATPGDVRAGKTFTSGTGVGLTGTATFSGGTGLVGTGQVTTYGSGSDGDLRRGAAPSFTDNGDGTVTDDRTGLTWEKKSADGSIHDVDAEFRWCADDDPPVGRCDAAGDPMDGTLATAFIAALNAAAFAGHSDWRVPNRKELESLVNLEAVAPATFAAFHSGCVPGCTVTTCSCTRPDAYWSSTTAIDAPADAWGESFARGSDATSDKTRALAVRAVRGGS